MNSLLNTIGIVITRDIKKRIKEGKILPKSKSEGTTLVKSSKLINSIHYAVTSSHVVIGTNLKYARIHHEGGIIKPVNHKYLAIPLTKAASTRKPRDWQNTFISKNIIFRTMDNGEIEALYALKTQVAIPARPYLLISDDTWSTLRKITIDFIDKDLKGGK